MKDAELPVVKDIESKFLDRVVSLVGYGSYFFDRAHDGSDIDLCLLLNTRDQDDLTILHNIVAVGENSHVDSTPHYLDEVKQWSWENFHHVSKVFSDKTKELHRKVMTQDVSRKDISNALQCVVSDFQKQLNRIYGNAAR